MNLLGGHMSAPAAAVDRDLEQVLLALADGSYVLSTPDGSVAESGIGVVGLLGMQAERPVGRPAADVLIPGAADAARAEFEQMLRAPVIDPGARRTFSARCADDATRRLQFVVVCVPLALGWEFTSLLSELRSRDAGTWHPEELRLRHGRALDAVEAVVRRGSQPDPHARLAGILIVVRDIDAPPLTREGVDRRMAEQRAHARAAAAEAARRADEAAGHLAPEHEEDAGARGPGLEDLVERARVLRERVEDAERDAAAAATERDEAVARLAQTEAERDAARALAAAVDDAEGRARRLASERDEARAEAQAAQTEVDSARAEAQAAAARARAAEAQAQSAQADAEAARAELEADDTRLADVRHELEVARGERDAMRAAVAAARAELAAKAAELDDTRAALEQAQAATADAHALADRVRAEREQARVRAQQLMDEAEQARAAAEAIRAEFAFEEPVADKGAVEPPARRAPPSVPATAATASPTAHAGDGAAQPELPAVGPGEAAALIALDGSFTRLDDAFCSLLGCREEDLRAARWPSIIDRENHWAHQEIARALKAGEIQSAEIDTVYMHAQGLLVPIAGTVSLHRPQGGDVPYFVLRADVSRTAGVPGVF